MNDYKAGAPIYLQIMDEMLRKIVSGDWPPGSRVSPVRELAVEFSVNPNTMQRTLAELEREGMMQSERTSGRFVTEDAERISRARREMALGEIGEFLKRMEGMGYNFDEIMAMMEGERHG